MDSYPAIVFLIDLLKDANLGATQTSEIVDLSFVQRVGVHVFWSGGTGTTGNIRFQMTNDDPQSPSAVYTNLSSTAVSTTSGNIITTPGYNADAYLRIVWERTAGTGGTINCRIIGRK